MKQPAIPKAPELIGQSKQAPGLRTRDGDILHKALGLTDSSPIHPMKLAALADNHPDPAVQKAAGNALAKLGFRIKGIYSPGK